MKVSRIYQTKIENEIPVALRDYQSVLVQGPTGCGKSHIIANTCKRIMRAGKVPLVLSDSKKIHQQLVRECDGVRITDSVKQLEIITGHTYVAMAQTLRNRPRILEQFHSLEDGLVVLVDEAHRNTMTPVVQLINPVYLAGFSATPHFKWAKHLPKLYRTFIHGPQIHTLQEEGFLAQYRHLLRTGAKLEDLEVKGQEYTEESQNRVFSSTRLYDGLYDDLPVYHNKKTVIYVASIKLCEEMYENLKQRGYRVTRYHSELQNATYELAKFTETNDADICVSVSALTLGWDYPPIDLVVLWRKTRSLPLYLQMCGRGGRPFDGKEFFTVLDYGSNYEMFGAWNMDRDWSEMWQDPKKKRKISTYAGVAGSKICPLCAAILAVTARSCYNCGYIYPESEIKLIQGQLIEVENSIKNLKKRTVGELNAEELARYGRFYNRKAFAIRIAKSKEQVNPGFLEAFATAMQYDKRWLNRQLESLPEERIEYHNLTIR